MRGPVVPRNHRVHTIHRVIGGNDRVTPHTPWRDAGVPRPDRFVLPPLLRGYLRLGAWICGAPAHDPDFGTADFFVLLSVADADPRYLRHFLGQTR